MALKIIIFTSTDDLASESIRNQLLKEFPFNLFSHSQYSSKNILSAHQYSIQNKGLEFHLLYLNVPMVKLDEYFSDQDFNADLIFFASRHRSESGQPALLCHTSGNWGSDTAFGGSPFQIAKGSATVLYYFYQGLKTRVDNVNAPFLVDQEVTHHGPTTFSLPMNFIELGSSEKEWNDSLGAKIVADTIIETGEKISDLYSQERKIFSSNLKICVGFGGTHYMPNFKRLIDKGYSFSHVVPKYGILFLNEDMIKQIQKRTLEVIDYWVLDWKGMGATEKAHLLPLLQETHIPIMKTKDLE